MSAWHGARGAVSNEKADTRRDNLPSIDPSSIGDNPRSIERRMFSTGTVLHRDNACHGHGIPRPRCPKGMVLSRQRCGTGTVHSETTPSPCGHGPTETTLARHPSTETTLARPPTNPRDNDRPLAHHHRDNALARGGPLPIRCRLKYVGSVSCMQSETTARSRARSSLVTKEKRKRRSLAAYGARKVVATLSPGIERPFPRYRSSPAPAISRSVTHTEVGDE